MLARLNPVDTGSFKSDPVLSDRSGAETLDWSVFSALIVGLAWVPYWYGSNELVAWGINALLFPTLAVTYEATRLVFGAPHAVDIKTIRWPLILWGASIGWAVIQNATMTPAFLHHPIWQMTAEALNKPIEGSISVNRDLTWLSLLHSLTAASVFWTALQICRNSVRVTYFLTAISAIVAIYSVYGIISLSLRPGAASLIGNAWLRGFLNSTFINRDHFATYAGIGFVVTCGLLFRFYEHTITLRGGSFRFRLASMIEASGRHGALLLGNAFLIFVALLMTGSRGGLIATSCGLLALTGLTLAGRSGVKAGRLGVLLLGIFFVAVVFVMFGDTIFGRISEGGISDNNRIAVYTVMIRSILDSPLLGYGDGTFLDIFPMFRDQSVRGQEAWEFAHNTYLETVQGLGLVFGMAFLASVALLLAGCVKGAIGRQGGMTAPRIAASVGFLIAANAVVDFSLQIQAVTLTFAAALGAGFAQSESSRVNLSD